MIAVLLTFLILGLIVAFGTFDSVDRVNYEATKADIRLIESSLKSFKNAHGSYPENLEELVEQGLMKANPVDPWGYEYNYLLRNGGYQLWSKGLQLSGQ